MFPIFIKPQVLFIYFFNGTNLSLCCKVHLPYWDMLLWKVAHARPKLLKCFSHIDFVLHDSRHAGILMATKVYLSTDFIIMFDNTINSYTGTHFLLFKVEKSYFINYLSLSLSHKPIDNGPSLNIRNASNTQKLEYQVLISLIANVHGL